VSPTLAAKTKARRGRGTQLTLLAMKLLSQITIALAVVAPFAPAQNSIFSRSTEMLVVTTPSWDAVDGHLQRFERGSASEAWRAAGEPIPIAVGGRGMGWGIGLLPGNGDGARLADEPVKHEGDGKSPAGIFTLGTAFGDAAQALPGTKLPYLELTPGIECVDDARSAHYNRVLDRTTTSTPDWNSSEHMLSVGEAYRWGIVINHNGTTEVPGESAPKPGGGSCVFLHIWGGPGHGTAGCTAMASSEIEVLLKWLDPKRRPLLVQMPRADYERLRDGWGLPRLAEVGARE
jgi:L,D-peptidoglycan transpeptidase YkuD (ErfK/YbiS/YcfS/YnhG family)